jgi:competence protein ComEC
MLKKILTQLEKEYQQWFLWTPVWLGFGIGIYFLDFNKVEFFYCFFVFFLSCLFLKKEKNGYRYFLLMGLLVCIGFIVADFRTKNLQIEMITKAKQNQVIEGVLENIEDHPRQSHMSRWTIDLCRLTILNNLAKSASLGDFIEIKADLLPFSQPLTQGSFDWRRHYFFKQIKATGRIKEILSVRKKEPSHLSKIRHLIGQHLKKNLSQPSHSIAKALMIGDTSGISQDIRQNFADAGLAHILAISGLHMSIVTGLVFITTRRFLALFPFIALRYPIKFFAFLIAMVSSFSYMLISGMGFPVIRSFCMGIFLMIGLMNGRNPISIRSVCLSATIILLFYPEALLSISFQLSFAAVLMLISCHSALPIENRFLHYFATMVLTTLLATLATFPFTIAAFQKITLQAITGNLLAIPLTTFWIMPSCFSIFFQDFGKRN